MGSYFRWEGIRSGFLEAVLHAESERINGVNKKGKGIPAGGKSLCNGWEAQKGRKQWIGHHTGPRKGCSART